MTLISSIGLILIGSGSVIVFQAISSIWSIEKEQRIDNKNINKEINESVSIEKNRNFNKEIDMFISGVDIMFGVNKETIQKYDQHDNELPSFEFVTFDSHKILVKLQQGYNWVVIQINNEKEYMIEKRFVSNNLSYNGVKAREDVTIIKTAKRISEQFKEETDMFISDYIENDYGVSVPSDIFILDKDKKYVLAKVVYEDGITKIELFHPNEQIVLGAQPSNDRIDEFIRKFL